MFLTMDEMSREFEVWVDMVRRLNKMEQQNKAPFDDMPCCAEAESVESDYGSLSNASGLEVMAGTTVVELHTKESIVKLCFYLGVLKHDGIENDGWTFPF